MLTSFKPSRRYYVLGVLVATYVFQILDRQLPAILLPSIKADLGLSDTELGFMVGPAFAIFFVMFGLPIAWLADRGSPRLVISVSVLLWSLFTAATGLARSFATIVSARLGVAVGEAGCSPTAHALVAHTFAPQERATALAIYYLGFSFGSLIAFAAGGWAGQFLGWRQAFLAAGIAGIFLAILAHTAIADPARAAGGTVRHGAISIRAALSYLLSRRTFVQLAVGAGLVNMAYIGGLQWTPSFFVRSHGLGTATIGVWLAMVSGVVSALGTFIGGWLSDRLARRDLRWYMWLAAAGMAVATPVAPLVFIVRDPTLAFLLLMFAWFFVALGVAPNYAVAQGLATPNMRAIASATLILLVSTLGLGVGPQLIGWLSDVLALQFGSDSLRYALIGVMMLGSAVPILNFIVGGRTLREEFAQALAKAES